MGLILLLVMLLLVMAVDLLLLSVSTKRTVIPILICTGKTASSVRFPSGKSHVSRNPVLMVRNGVTGEKRGTAMKSLSTHHNQPHCVALFFAMVT